jgi:hypothetical protein
VTILLTGEFKKGTMARAVPGAYYSREGGGWVLDEPTPRGAAVALRLFPDLAQRHPEMVAARDELLKDVRPFDFATPWVEEHDVCVQAPRVRAVLKDMGWRLHEYQETDLAYGTAVLQQRGAFYLGWERGLGKTLGTCVLIESLGRAAHARGRAQHGQGQRVGRRAAAVLPVA